MKVLVTSTSFQDVPGSHKDLLASTGWEIQFERGPLSESRMMELAGSFDAFLCGDDAITRAVIEKALPRLKVISKYGIGVDKIDVAFATEKKLPVLFTPGVNHTTVAEHAFTLMLALTKNLIPSIDATRQGQWKRMTGYELYEKTLGIVGMGRIGKEMAIRASAFGMKTLGYDLYWDDAFAAQHHVERVTDMDTLFKNSDIVSLHTNLSDATRGMVNPARLALMKKGSVLINTGRGELVENDAVLDALKSGQLSGYAADVLDQEPPPADHPFLKAPNCLVTPHVASRTYESVVRQATMSLKNLMLAAKGEKPLAQVNQVPIQPIA